MNSVLQANSGLQANSVFRWIVFTIDKFLRESIPQQQDITARDEILNNTCAASSNIMRYDEIIVGTYAISESVVANSDESRSITSLATSSVNLAASLFVTATNHKNRSKQTQNLGFRVKDLRLRI